ncbi:MAG TPA: alpha/beta hydrolase, partial [Sphingobacteriaceae bacterium]
VDGIELSEYLIKYLGKQKIILMGTSWGSVLGVKMALARPELYHAYVGHSQIVNASTGLTHAYNKVVEMAERAHDQEALTKLKSLGPPPYDDAKNDGQLLRIIKKYEKEHSVPPPAAWWRLASEYDNEKDAKDRYNGDDYSFINYAGHKKLGIKSMASGVDLMKDGLNFKVPVYLIQGEADILTAKELTKEYFDNLRAPEKEFLLLPGVAHGHNQSVIDAQYKLANKSVL